MLPNIPLMANKMKKNVITVRQDENMIRKRDREAIE
jgi:hypothetical protein